MKKRRIILVLLALFTAMFLLELPVKSYEDTCLPDKFTSEIIFDPQNKGKHPPFFLPGEQVQVKIEFSRPPNGCEGFDVVLESNSPYISFQNPIKKPRSLEMTMIISSDPGIVKSANPKIIAMLIHGSRSIVLEKDIIIGEKTQIQELTVAPVGVPISFHGFNVAVSDSGKNSLSYCLLVLTNETGIETDRKDKTVVYGEPMPEIRLMPNEAGAYTVIADCKNFAGASKVATNTFLVNLSEDKRDKPHIITESASSGCKGESFTVDFSRTNSFGRGLRANISDITPGRAITFGQCGSSQCVIVFYSNGLHKLKLDMQYQFPNFKYSSVSSAEIWVTVTQNQSGLPTTISDTKQMIQQPRQAVVTTPTVIVTASSVGADSGCVGYRCDGGKPSPGLEGSVVIVVLVILALRTKQRK